MTMIYTYDNRSREELTSEITGEERRSKYWMVLSLHK